MNCFPPFFSPIGIDTSWEVKMSITQTGVYVDDHKHLVTESLYWKIMEDYIVTKRKKKNVLHYRVHTTEESLINVITNILDCQQKTQFYNVDLWIRRWSSITRQAIGPCNEFNNFSCFMLILLPTTSYTSLASASFTLRHKLTFQYFNLNYS